MWKEEEKGEGAKWEEEKEGKENQKGMKGEKKKEKRRKEWKEEKAERERGWGGAVEDACLPCVRLGFHPQYTKK